MTGESLSGLIPLSLGASDGYGGIRTLYSVSCIWLLLAQVRILGLVNKCLFSAWPVVSEEDNRLHNIQTQSAVAF
jgi:hypothetical protein